MQCTYEIELSLVCPRKDEGQMKTRRPSPGSGCARSSLTVDGHSSGSTAVTTFTNHRTARNKSACRFTATRT